MKSEFFETPAALVRQAEASLGDIASEIKERFVLAERATREGLEHFRAIGDLLAKAKARVPHGQWANWLADNMPFGRKQAWKYMRLAAGWEQLKCLPEGTFDLNAAIKALAEDSPLEQQLIPGTVSGPWPDDQRCRDCRVNGRNVAECRTCQTLNRLAYESVPPPRAAKLCSACKAKGAYTINCPECAALNGGARKAPGPDPEATKSREEFGPGADDGEIDAQQERYDEGRLKKVTAPLWRECRKLAELHGLSIGKSYADPGTDPVFRPVLRKLGDARDELKRLARKLEQGTVSGAGKKAEGATLPE